MTHVMMLGSDSEDSGFSDDLALPSTQAARISSAGPASGKKTQTKGAIGWRAAALGEGVSLEPCAGAPETRSEA